MSKPDLFEADHGELAFPPADLSQRSQSRIRPHEHHFKYGQREDRVKGLPLRDIPRRMRQAVESILNVTCECRNEPKHASEEGGLAGAVRTEQCEELPTFNGKRKPFEYCSA